MKKEELSTLVKVIGAVVPKTPIVPISSCIKIKEGVVSVTNLEVTVEMKTELIDDSIVEADLWCKGMSSVKEHEIKVEKNQYIIFNGAEKVSIPGGDYKMEEFPTSMVNKPDDKVVLGTIGDKEIDKITTALKFANTEDILRPHLLNVHYHEYIVGLDGFWAYYHKTDNPLSQEILLPKTVCRLLGLVGGEFEVAIHGEKAGSFTGKNITIAFKLPETEFPNFLSVIPTEFDYMVELNRKDFLDCVNKAAIYGNSFNHMAIKIDGDNLSIESMDTELKTSYSSDLDPILVKNDLNELGAKMEIGFMATNMATILKCIEEETVVIQMIEPEKGAVINDEYLLMPIHLS